MRQIGGATLTKEEWDALEGTKFDPSDLGQQPERFIQETDGGYEASYLWSIVTMACVTRAMISARQQEPVLFYGQAVDFSEQLRGCEKELYSRMLAVPNLSNASRLPGWVMLHVGMRVRLTTQAYTAALGGSRRVRHGDGD